MKLKIKVCGMRDAVNLNALTALKPDYIGLIFYPPSSRYIGTSETQEHLKQPFAEGIKKTGVFVNRELVSVINAVESYKLQAVQLHGYESPEFCASLKQATGIEVIKVFSVDDDFDFSLTQAYLNKADLFLFDTKGKDFGGNGVKFNWEKLNEYNYQTPFFLSGGIAAEDMPDIKKIKHPQLIGIDLNSKFEIEPGLKNIDLLKTSVFDFLNTSK